MRWLKNHYHLIVLLLLGVFFVALGFKGFDVCDEGWYATFYQQFYSNPETVEYNFLYYLMGFIGGMVYEIVPNGGILSFRLLAVLVILTTFYLVLNLLKGFGGKSYVLGACIMVTLVSDFGYLAFGYNYLTALLCVIGITMLFYAIKTKNSMFFFLAGLSIALNIFARIPNLLQLALGLVIPLQLYLNNDITMKRVFHQMIKFGLGIFTGLALVILFMWFNDHLEIMKNAIGLLIDKGANADSNHNLGRLLKVYFNNHVLVVKSLIKFFLTIILLGMIFKLLSRSKILSYLIMPISTVVFFVLFKSNAVYYLYGLGVMGSIVVFVLGSDRFIKSLAFMSFIMTILIPIGSDGGINNAGYASIWISVPLFFSLCTRKLIEFNHNVPIFNALKRINTKRFVSLVSIGMVLGFSTTKIHNIMNQSYFDYGNRLEKNSTINSSLASNIKTTERRAKIINDLLKEIENYVQPNDYLLAYDNIPMINYLTKTKPYMYQSWVWVYDGYSFKKQLKRAEKEIDSLPVVVLQKFQTIGSFSEPMDDYLSEYRKENYFFNSSRAVAMNSFLKRNNYVEVFTNNYFSILEPPKSN